MSELERADIQNRIEEVRRQATVLQDALLQWRECGFPERTLILLLKDATGVNMRDIKAILDGLECLPNYFQEPPEEL